MTSPGHGGRRQGSGRKPLPPEVKEARKLARQAGNATVPAAPKPPAGAWGDPKALMALAEMIAAKGRAKVARSTPFLQLPKPPPGVVPKGFFESKAGKKMAMDQATAWADGQWAALGPLFNSVASQGLQFLGYPFLSELAQRTEYRVISETIADDATRKWIDFEVTGEKEREEKDDAERDRVSAERQGGGTAPKVPGQDLSPEPWKPEGEEQQGEPALRGRGFTDEDPEKRADKVKAAGKMEKVKALKDEIARLALRDHMYCICRDDGLFGRTHLALKFGKKDGDDSDEELKKDIGDGRDEMSRGKVGKDNPLRAVKPIEPVWTFPMAYNAINPLADDWYAPQNWYVMGRQIHVSRLLPFVGHPVPDLLKPAYSFGGLSLSQLVLPYVDIWLRTRDSVGELIHAFSVMCLATDVQTILAPGASGGPGALLARADAFNAFRDNMGLFIFNKNTEDFKNVSAPLGGLHELEAQSQEHVASAARIPLIKFTGLQPAGLNASAESEVRAYYDTIAGYQNRFERPNLTKVINFIQLSLWGEVDPEITFEFEPLWEMSEKEKADLQKAQGERDQIYVDMGALAPEEVRKNVIDDPAMPYSDLDPDDVPELKQEEMQGLVPEGAGKGLEAVIGEPGQQQPGGQAPQPAAGAGGGGGEAHDPAFQEDEALDEPAPPRGLPWADRYEWMRGFDIPATDASGNQIAPTARGEAARKGLRIGSRVRYASGTGRAVGFVNDADNERVAILDAENDRFLCAPIGTVSTRPVTAHDEGEARRRNATVLPFSGDVADLDPLFAGLAADAWEESEHPRGQPGNAGEFASTGGGSSAPKAKGYGWHGGPAQHFQMPQLGLHLPPGGGEAYHRAPPPPLDPSKLKKVGPQMGSNPGGVFEDEKGRKFYVKQGRSKDHVRNEMTAADLYELAGAPTLRYRDVAGGEHVASEMEKLDKTNASEMSDDEVRRAKRDFLAHAWTSNYDAVGTGGDNLVAAGHDVFSVDLGGALEYRARGAPKGETFGDKVTEIDTMRDPKIAPDASEIFGDITPAEFRESAAKVTSIPDDEIREVIKARGGSDALADKMIARKNDIAKRAKTFGAEGDPKKKTSTVIFPAGDALPVKELNGIAFKEWKPPADGDWNEVDGQTDIEDEAPLPDSAKGKQLASGLIIREKDGRVWLVQPKNAFGGYSSTFPKGRVEPSLSLQANAIKEAFEETGLKGRITGLAGDREGDATLTRYYLADREAGDPSKPGPESEGVVLAPPQKLKGFLNRERDLKLAKEIVGDEAPGPRTLYVNRPLLNAGDLIKWVHANGIKKTLPPEDIHVTVAFSKEPVEWADIGTGEAKVVVPGNGGRLVELLGDKGAVVLRFESARLTRRWEDIREVGASWDWPGYKPHVTITYDPGDVDLSKVEPYAGPLEFGPERFAEVDPDAADKAKAALIGDAGWEESKHPRGQPENKGQFGSGGGGQQAPKRTSAGRPGGPARPAARGSAMVQRRAPAPEVKRPDATKVMEKATAEALEKATSEERKEHAGHVDKVRSFFSSDGGRAASAKAVKDFAAKHAAGMAKFHVTDAILLPAVHQIVEHAVTAIGLGGMTGVTLGATAVAAYAVNHLMDQFHFSLGGAKEVLGGVLRNAVDVLGGVKEVAARISELEKAGQVGDEERDDSVLDALILLLLAVEETGEEQAHDAALALDELWEESKHPRDKSGEFTTKGGEFASAPGGASKKKTDEEEPLLTVGQPAKSWAKPGTIPHADSGPRMPDTVYRGAGPENEEQSGMAEGKGVYVSAFPEIAAQWGQPKKYKVKKQPNLVDLGDFDSDAAKRLVGAWLGKSPKSVTKEEFDEEAPQLFIQNNAVEIADRMGFNGYRLGGDIFLIGKLSDYAEKGEPMKTKPDIRKNMVREFGESTQPVKSLDELYDRARAEEPAFRAMVEHIAEATGSKPKFGPEVGGSILKTRESSERKLKDELGGDFTKLRDVLRGTVVGDSVEKTRDAAAAFIAKQGDNVLRVKDRHVGSSPSGYRDILVNFRTPGGLVAELQFNSKAMTQAKEEQGHKLYDSIRTGSLAGKSFDELQEMARTIYEKAYQTDGDGNWGMEGK